MFYQCFPLRFPVLCRILCRPSTAAARSCSLFLHIFLRECPANAPHLPILPVFDPARQNGGKNETMRKIRYNTLCTSNIRRFTQGHPAKKDIYSVRNIKKNFRSAKSTR